MTLRIQARLVVGSASCVLALRVEARLIVWRAFGAGVFFRWIVDVVLRGIIASVGCFHILRSTQLFGTVFFARIADEGFAIFVVRVAKRDIFGVAMDYFIVPSVFVRIARAFFAFHC